MATVNITYFGMEGTGKTVTEAKRNAGEKIEQALSGPYDPILFPLPDGAIMTGYRTPTFGWAYGFWRKGQLGGGAFGLGESRDECERKMRKHAAQYAYDASYLDHRTCTDDDRDGFSRWHRFQETYKRAIEQGHSDTEAHALACGA